MNSIYIHIPFCERKCFYCDFYSIEDLSNVKSYINSLKKEIILYYDKGYFSEVQTLFFGGGTPSKLEDRLIGEILECINKHYKLNEKCEISIEVNPGSVNKNSLIHYKEYGINRISIGVQSFIQEELNLLERVHSVNEANEAILTARECGFNNVSIDLIYAIPLSTLDHWKYNLDKAIELNPKHISAYSLIFEEGTRLYDEMTRNKVQPAPEELEAQMFEYTINFLKSNNYVHYEVSNYAFPGFECQHNKNYWNFSNYIGMGPSAHSFFNKTRWWNFCDINKYQTLLEKDILPIESFENIDDNLLIEEIVFLGLRSDGIDLDLISGKFNIDFYKKNENIITDLLKNEYIELNKRKIKLTDRGFLICDEISKKLI